MMSGASDPLIRVEGIRKVYRVRRAPEGRFVAARALLSPAYEERRAVDDVSFSIEPGESVGYLGPNGAGKSTTIKMLTGILVPTSGTVRVGALVPWRHRHENARRIGVVFGQRTQLYWDLPLKDTLELLRDIYEVPTETYRGNMALFSDLLGLGEFLHQPVRQLSLGQRMRGDLAAAMLHNPSILYLDEPTVGLDIVAKQQILDMIAGIKRERGVTVLLTTHNLDDVEQLCPRIILIDRGRVRYDGDLENFKWEHAPYKTLVVYLAREAEIVDIPAAETTRRDPLTLEIRYPRVGIAPHELIARIAATYDVRDLSLEEPSLEGILRDLYRGERAGEEAVG